MDGQVSGLGTVHPLLTINLISTWILPLHVVSSTLKRKSSSSVMDGLQRRRRSVAVEIEGENKVVTFSKWTSVIQVELMHSSLASIKS